MTSPTTAALQVTVEVCILRVRSYQAAADALLVIVRHQPPGTPAARRAVHNLDIAFTRGFYALAALDRARDDLAEALAREKER
jgi:hypothetical protein